MSKRLRPDWDYSGTGFVVVEPLPDFLDKEIRDVLDEFEPAGVDLFIKAVVRAISSYRTSRACDNSIPSKQQRRDALESLARDAQMLAARVESFGGANLEVIFTLMETETDTSAELGAIQSALDRLSSICSQAIDKVDVVGAAPGRSEAERGLAYNLAISYSAAFCRRPASTIDSDTSREHPFVSVLRKITKTYGQREVTPSSAQKIAAHGIRLALGRDRARGNG